MKTLKYASFLAFLVIPGLVSAQTVRARPYSTASLASYQVQYKGIDTCTSGSPCVVTTTDTYLGSPLYTGKVGASSGFVVSAGVISVGASSCTVTIQDSGGFIVANAWALSANTAYQLDAIRGAWMIGGFSFYSTGAGCSTTHAEFFFQK